MVGVGKSFISKYKPWPDEHACMTLIFHAGTYSGENRGSVF